MFSDLFNWLDERLGVSGILSMLFDEPIPGGARWSYVFGSALLFVFGLQAVTGIILTMYYVPAADVAHTSVAYIQKAVAGGSFLRGLHHWGSTMMVVLLGIHMLQVFLWGAYKKPREMVWVFGGGLMLLVLGFSFTGYLLPWDQKAYFATQVGTNVASEVPGAGSFMKAVALGGNRLGTLTLSRFYTVHTMILPVATVLFIFLHLYAFRRVGPAGPFRRDDPRLRTTEAFYPKQFLYDTIAALLIFSILAVLAVTHPAVLEPKANPSDTTYLPRPEWYFLPLFQLLKIFQGELVIVGTVIIPGLIFTLLFLVPFLDRRPERHPLKRRLATFSMAGILALLGGLLLQAKRDDGAFLSADQVAALTQLTPEQVSQLDESGRLQREAALARETLDRQALAADKFLQEPFQPYVAGGAGPKQRSLPAPPKTYQACAECHGDIGGGGGMLGPDLIDSAKRYTAEQLNQLILDPEASSISGMPKFTEDKLSAEERNALVDYLVRLSKN